MYKIEKNVSIARATKFPFSAMEVGDSFAVPEEDHKSCAVTASGVNKSTDKRFTVRKHDGAYRCWRVA